jgi:hypothetical protein
VLLQEMLMCLLLFLLQQLILLVPKVRKHVAVTGSFGG